MASIEASELFNDEANWRFCQEQATFRHTGGDACEFVLHIGEDPAIRDADSFYVNMIDQMREYGCTAQFIAAYRAAKAAGAVRVLLWA